VKFSLWAYPGLSIVGGVALLESPFVPSSWEGFAIIAGTALLIGGLVCLARGLDDRSIRLTQDGAVSTLSSEVDPHLVVSQALADAKLAADRYQRAERELQALVAEPVQGMSSDQVRQALADVFSISDELPCKFQTRLLHQWEVLNREYKPEQSVSNYVLELKDYLNVLTQEFDALMDIEIGWWQAYGVASPTLRAQMLAAMVANRQAGRHVFAVVESSPSEQSVLPETQSPLMPIPT